MHKFGKELVGSMTEACEHTEGKPGRVATLKNWGAGTAATRRAGRGLSAGDRQAAARGAGSADTVRHASRTMI